MTVTWIIIFLISLWVAEAVVRRCSVKKVFLEISQGNTCAKVFFCMQAYGSGAGVFLWICEISKNALFYRTSLVAVSGVAILFPNNHIKDNV